MIGLGLTAPPRGLELADPAEVHPHGHPATPFEDFVGTEAVCAFVDPVASRFTEDRGRHEQRSRELERLVPLANRTEDLADADLAAQLATEPVQLEPVETGQELELRLVLEEDLPCGTEMQKPGQVGFLGGLDDQFGSGRVLAQAVVHHLEHTQREDVAQIQG